MNIMSPIGAIASPHLVGNALPQPLAHELMLTLPRFAKRYTTFVACHGAAPNLLGTKDSWSRWVHARRSLTEPPSPPEKVAMWYIKGWEENALWRRRWNFYHDLTLVGLHYGHTCISQKERHIALPHQLWSGSNYPAEIKNLRQAYHGKGGNRLTHLDVDVCNKALKSFVWVAPRSRKVNSLLKRLKARPFTAENLWFLNVWAPLYRFRVQNGPLFLQQAETLPDDIRTLVESCLTAQSRACVATWPKYKQTALAQCLLAAPHGAIPADMFQSWLHPDALGHTTQHMPELCALPTGYT